MKDNSREVYVTHEGIPLNIRITLNGDGCPWIDTVVVDGSTHDIWPLLSLSTDDKLEEKVEEYLREEKLQQEMDIAEDRALWRDM